MARDVFDPAFDPSSPLRKELRRVVGERDGWRCRFCGRRDLVVPPAGREHTAEEASSLATLDHWLPRSRGGTWEMFNLVLACRPCNGEKGQLTGEEYLTVLAFRRRQRAAGNTRQFQRCRSQAARCRRQTGRHSAAMPARDRHCRRPAGGTPQPCRQP